MTIVRPLRRIANLAPRRRSSSRTFAIWADEFGDPIRREDSPFHYPRWAVLAGSPNQAHAFVRDAVTPAQRTDGRGVVWDRCSAGTAPPPLSADTLIHPWTLAWCRSPTAMRHANFERAERALAQIDHTGCGGACYRDHEIRWMSRAEAQRLNPPAEVWG